MLKKLASVVIVTALVCTLGGTSVFASNTANPDEKTDPARIPAETPAKEEAKTNQQLKTNILKLVADAKAGKISSTTKSQMQPAKSNHWSKRTKIIIVVGVAAAVVVTILVVNHARNHFFDDFRPFSNN
jgi:flagellar basal body-associated protein FliL